MKFKLDSKKSKELRNRIKEHAKKPAPLMPSLYDAQEIFGCVPIPVQKVISKELNIPIAKINSIITFYPNFSLVPKGKYVIRVCKDAACSLKGSGNIINELKTLLGIDINETTKDNNFTLETTTCVAACGLAPVVVMGDEIIGTATIDMVKEKIEKVNENEENAK